MLYTTFGEAFRATRPHPEIVIQKLLDTTDSITPCAIHCARSNKACPHLSLSLLYASALLGALDVHVQMTFECPHASIVCLGWDVHQSGLSETTWPGGYDMDSGGHPLVWSHNSIWFHE